MREWTETNERREKKSSIQGLCRVCSSWEFASWLQTLGNFFFFALTSLENKAAALITTFVVDFQVTVWYFLFGDWDWTLGEISDDLESRQVGFVFLPSRKGLEVVISITSRYVIVINIFSQFRLSFHASEIERRNTSFLREMKLLRIWILLFELFAWINRA